MVEHVVSREHRDFAKAQRSQMTRAEALLWQAIRAGRLNGLKFKRQAPLGGYVADFVCFEARPVVEVDGDSHRRADRAERDRVRDGWFIGEGFRVLRFSDDAVLGGLPLVCAGITGAATPSPGLLRKPPSPARGEGRAEPFASNDPSC